LRVNAASIFILHSFASILDDRAHRPLLAIRALNIMTTDRSGNATGLAGRFTLATKLYAIFALFALLTAAIAMLSDYNSRRSAELTAAIETANAAALNVERVNSLVYAVVMESRGVYMSTEPAVVKKYGEGLLKFNEHGSWPKLLESQRSVSIEQVSMGSSDRMWSGGRRSNC